MGKLIDDLYYRLPVFMQNLAVTLYGLKLKAERFNVAGRNQARFLEESRSWGGEQIRDYQERKFIEFARHAIRNTDYYRRWAHANGISESDIRTLEDIKIFPVIDKSTVRCNPEAFYARSRSMSHLVLYTSGTTGAPLKVLTDRDSRSRHYAFFTRLRRQYGIAQGDRRATLFGRIIIPAWEQAAPFWRHDVTNSNLLMSSYHLGPSNLHLYYKKLVKYSPKEIFAYPSSLFVLAKYIVDNGLKPINVNLVMTTAEHLSNEQARYITQAFIGPLVNQYGCTEMAFFAFGEMAKDMFFEPEHGLVEVEDETGELLEYGEGDLIATGLINMSMPIIRYRVGDNVKLSADRASAKVKLEHVIGRSDDVIYSAVGTPVGRLDPVFKGDFGILQSQIEQQPNGSVIVRLVLEREQEATSICAGVKAEMIKRLGNGLDIEVRAVHEINKGKSGKVRAVICNYKP